ncbi:MAG: hypothetical protein VX498_12570 [Myxococcota bacterium]|nr:hypothetical protein [Myxococcota bacterium]
MIGPALRILLVLALSLIVTTCPGPQQPSLPMGDAGDEAFVKRLLPVLWGRGPDSIAEVDLLVQLLEQTDRRTLVRLMANSPDYNQRWRDFFYDELFVNRIGERSNEECFGVARVGVDDGSLAAWVRDRSPEEGTWPESFSMDDLVRSSLVLDDLSPIYRANLFSQLARDFLMQGPEAAEILRQNSFEIFEKVYLNRQMPCLECHNSEYSSTDHPDPALDRSWPVPGLVERAIYGESTGRSAVDVYPFFRRHGALAGHDMFDIQYFGNFTGCHGRDGPGCDGCACEEVVCSQMPSCCETNWTTECATLCSAADLGCVPGLPEGFDGCEPLPGHPGCGDCDCEEVVCSFHPDCCEFSWLNHCADFCTLWGPECLLDDPPEYLPDGLSPWGLHPDCGIFVPPSEVVSDPLEVDAFFVDSVGTAATIWDLEERLAQGFADLRNGLAASPDDPLEGRKAFAWMVSLSLADSVWQEVHGSPLTIANHFPRNQDQRDLLVGLATVFVDSGYSLVELLTAVVNQPSFNLPVPSELDPASSPYDLPAVFDPWVTDHEVEELRGNGLGELIHRKPPRVLVDSAAYALQFRPLPDFPDESESVSREARLQEDLGFRLKDSVHGFPGNDFQGLSSWEFVFGSCTEPPLSVDGCGPRLDAGCDGCACEENVCAARPSCCEVRWDATCGGFCSSSPQGCQPPEEPPVVPPDWIQQVVESAGEGALLEEAVSALKDRILTDPLLADDGERAVLEALLQFPLETPLTELEDAEGALRWACSVFLASPQFQLMGDPGPDRRGHRPGVEVPSVRPEALCLRTGETLLPEGTWSCTDGILTVSP